MNGKYAFIYSLFFIALTTACGQEDPAPVVTASFTPSVTSGNSPLEVVFTNTSQNAVAYAWSFGDAAISAEKDPSHTYINTSTTEDKTFTVTLVSTDASGKTATATATIKVNKSTNPTNGKTTAIFNSAVTYGTMTDQDGNVYKTVTIGTQTWMAENLRTTKYRNGDPIPSATDATSWKHATEGAWCLQSSWTTDAHVATYGRLYNWYAVSDSRNIAPAGWHVPTASEWKALATQLGGMSVAGGKMKEIGNTHWNGTNYNATNSSGFTGVATGTRDAQGNFGWENQSSNYWSKTTSEGTPFSYYLINGREDLTEKGDYKIAGFSVRLVKD